MTEPIAVDVPVKMPPVPGAKPEPPTRAEPPKPASAEPKKPEGPPFPTTKAASPTRGLLGRLGSAVAAHLTRRQAVIAASAAFSLLAGIAGVRLMWPPAAPPQGQEQAAANQPASPAPTPDPAATQEQANKQPDGPLAPDKPSGRTETTTTVATPAAEAPARFAAVPPTPPDPVKSGSLAVRLASAAPVARSDGPKLSVERPAPAGDSAATLTLPALPPVPPVGPDMTPPTGPKGDDFKPVRNADEKAVAVVQVGPISAPGGSITPTAGAEPEKPAVPPPTSVPAPLPTVPAPGSLNLPEPGPVAPTPPTPMGGTTSPAPARTDTNPTAPATPAGGMNPTPSPDSPGPAVPPVTAPGSPAVPLPPIEAAPSGPAVPGVPPNPATTPATLPEIPMNPTRQPDPPAGPASPGGTGSAPPSTTGPALPPIPGSPVVPTPSPSPAALPPSVGPNTPATPPAQMPAAAPPAGPGTRIEFTKPGGTTEVRPAGVAEQPPRTSFDVDLYEPRLGDTYESIAREYYNDTRYAAALRAYNQNKTLQNSGPVDVPPIHVLRKQHPQLIGTGAAPAGRSGSGTPPAGEWAPAGGTVSSAGAVEPQPAFRSAGTSRTFTVPAGGMTLRAIARHTLGSEQRWAAIWEANPQITKADGVIPAGTVLQLPAGARVPD